MRLRALKILVNILLFAGMSIMAVLIVRTIALSAMHEHGTAPSSDTVQKSAGEQMKDAMAEMHRKMSSQKTIGQPDYDFCALMIPHHEGAVQMAKIYLLYGEAPIIKTYAQKIIADQSEEILQMQGLMKRLESSAYEPTDMATALREAMAPMMAAMDVPTTGDPDRDFLTLMIPHHEGAIKMAEAVLPHLKSSAVQTLAKRIIEAQSREIELMRTWLEGHEKTP